MENGVNKLQLISDILRQELKKVAKKLYMEKVSDRTLDEKVFEKLSPEIKRKRRNISITMQFLPPADELYRVEGGRTPYDILVRGNIDDIPFKIFLNNKYGTIFTKSGKPSSTRNDVTTYNNLLRLYLGITTQRLRDKIEIDKRLIRNRIAGKEIVSYAIFVIDKTYEAWNFFVLEEVKDPVYINPRNTMYQVRYKPDIREKPIDYYSFVIALIDGAKEALEKAVQTAKTEILALSYIEKILRKIKNVRL